MGFLFSSDSDDEKEPPEDKLEEEKEYYDTESEDPDRGLLLLAQEHEYVNRQNAIRQTINKQGIEKAITSLEKRLKLKISRRGVPEVFKNHFYEAALRFSTDNIDNYKMGYAEEGGDIAYQTIKLICVNKGIVTPSNQRALYDKYANYINSNKLKCNIYELYNSARSLVSDRMIENLSRELPQEGFTNKNRISIDFLANQCVSFISRVMGNNGNIQSGFHTSEYIKKERIPEEIAELVDILGYPTRRKKSLELLEDIKHNLYLCSQLVDTARFIADQSLYVINPCNETNLLELLNKILKEKLENINLEDALNFALFKIRGRQELTFKGMNEKEVRAICKPIEYIMEAGLVM